MDEFIWHLHGVRAWGHSSPALILTFQFDVYECLLFFDLAMGYGSKGRVLNERDLSKRKSTQKVSDLICLFLGVM